MRHYFLLASILLFSANLFGYFYFPGILWSLTVIGPLFLLGCVDMLQKKQSIRRNFPVIGHFRYLFESIRPEINQYFIESNSDGRPFSREQRSIIYQRSKSDLETLPFGTQKNVYEVGYEWITHSLAPRHIEPKSLRVKIGGSSCTKPYEASIFNASAMSFGSLSSQAVLALNGGAKLDGFYQNTGEGGLTRYHLDPGGDIVWQIGTGYFSCRDEKGNFSPDAFAEKASHPNVKMIEVKLSQGAKPSHGGILPAKKLTKEIAAIRGVPMGQDVLSPPAHSAFSNPVELLEFIQELRTLSGGKPVGFKLCVGKRREFISICLAMIKTGILPDFITIDGGEGGSGAAPLEFSNHVGYPLNDGLVFVHNALVGYSLRKQIRLIVSGRIVTGFDILTKFALGADLCNSARAMMMSLGCIQALRCNSNRCPTGVATQDPLLARGIDVEDKRVRVARYHSQTVKSVAELLGALGLKSSRDVRPWHVMRRTESGVNKHYGEIYEFLSEGALLNAHTPASFERTCKGASSETFEYSLAG